MRKYIFALAFCLLLHTSIATSDSDIIDAIKAIVPCVVQTDDPNPCLACKAASCAWNPSATLVVTFQNYVLKYPFENGLCWAGSFASLNQSEIKIPLIDASVRIESSPFGITTLICGVPDLIGLLSVIGAGLLIVLIISILCCCCRRKRRRFAYIN